MVSRKSIEKSSDFGKRLKEIFDNSSNQSIAEKLNVGNSALTAYIQGRIPPPEKLIEIFKITNCNLNWLLTGEGSKVYLPQVQRPQGIILQGSKGGIGASTSAVFISINLALRGYKVLLANDVLNECFNLLFSQKEVFLSTTNKLFEKKETESINNFDHDYYISTKQKNLDLFIPRTMRNSDFSGKKLKIFDLESTKISKQYDFVIFDIQRSENPFYYPHTIQLENFYLEPILRNAKVIIPYDILQSHLDSVKRTIEYVEKQKNSYPDADFSGIFLVQTEPIYKSLKPFYEKKLIELKTEVRSKLFRTKVEFSSQLKGFVHDIQKIMFSRKTKVFFNFTNLIDEVLCKVNYQRK